MATTDENLETASSLPTKGSEISDSSLMVESISTETPIPSTPPVKRIKLNEDKTNSDNNIQTRKTPKKNPQYNLRTKKTPQKNKPKENLEKDDEYDNEINELLEEKSWKNNLTAINVKNILKHVITNEHVLAMVRNTMKEDKANDSAGGTFEEAVFEPKLTRSKAKELMEKNANVPWPISPIKKPQIACNLMETEFSDEENSSDEEYKPEADDESQLDKSSNSQLDDSIDQSPPSQTEPSASPAEPETPEPESETLIFSSIASLTDSFDQLSAGDTIACRTRSKLPLTDTPLETIEWSFEAPDITVDMYDSGCDDKDWMEFLKDYITTPIKNNPNDVGDDETEDPEYNFLEDYTENEETDQEDLRNDRAVKISKKEISELMAELFEAADMELDDDDEESEKNKQNTQSTDFALSMASKVMDERDNSSPNSNETFALIGRNERLQLEEQMRKHVQLLTQGFILSSSVEEYRNIKDYYSTLLIELQAFAIHNTLNTGHPSAFNAWNLTDAIELVTSFTDDIVTHQEVKKFRKKNAIGLSDKAKHVLSESKVFIYPELLPPCGFSPEFKIKVTFSAAEDNLLALGLEQFLPLKDQPCNKLIQELMLPAKTEMQIRYRIKNLRTLKAPENPVKYFYKHNQLQPRVVTLPPEFRPEDVKPPIEQPKNLLPMWLSKRATHKLGIRPVLITPKTSESQSIIVTNIGQTPVEQILRTPEKNQNSSTATTNRISPLKQISPILKKYSSKRFKRTGGNLNKQQLLLPKGIPLFMLGPMKDRKLAPRRTVEIEKKSEGTSNEAERKTEDFSSEVSEMVSSSVKSNETPAEETHVESTTETENKPEETSEHFLEIDSQSDVELFDDEEEPLDNADDLAALMAASSTIQSAPKGKQAIGKRCSRQQRDTRAKLQLLASDLLESDPMRDERETAFAQSYLLRVKELTKHEENIYESFLKLLYEFGQSEKTAVQLHREVCRLLREFPQLCNEFVTFLMPEQAMECGKLLEYLQFKQMRLFLRKIEIHFHKNPQHMQKILKTLAQCQEQIHMGLDHIKSIIQPLFRGRAQLMEDFLQLFPTESPTDSLLSDFEEVTLPDSDAEMDDDGYETVILPEDKYDYGGKNCQCQCHNSQDLKLQKRIRHCVPCGTKFIDGRIYIQTGKSLRPARVIYMNSQKTNPPPLVQSPEEHVIEPTSPCSESSSVSSLSPTDLKDSEEEREVTCQTDYTHQSNLTLPTDAVSEDAILTPVIDKSTSEIPADFSSLREVLGQDKLISSSSKESSDPTTTGSQEETSKSENENSEKESLTLSAKNHSVNEKGDVIVLWTKEADRLILKTCQQLGVTDVAFQIVSHQLGNKSVAEVRDRFSELIRLFSAQSNDMSGSESETEEK